MSSCRQQSLKEAFCARTSTTVENDNYGGREGHWTRFQISDAIFRLRTSDAILLWPRGALDSISDLRRNFRLRTRFSDFRLRTSDAIFRLRTRFSDLGLDFFMGFTFFTRSEERKYNARILTYVPVYV